MRNLLSFFLFQFASVPVLTASNAPIMKRPGKRLLTQKPLMVSIVAMK